MLAHTTPGPTATHVLRLVSAFVSIPIVLGCAWAGGAWFSGLVLVVVALAAIEIAGMQRALHWWVAIPTALISSLAIPTSTALGDPSAAWLLLGLGGAAGLVGVASRLPTRTPMESDAVFRPVEGWAVVMAGGVYVGALLAPAINLRALPDGLMWVTVILAGTWACDTAAFLTGRQFGRHRLAPTVSPSKSVEGTIAGVIAAAAVAAIAIPFVGQPWLRMIGLGIVVGLAAVCGDLAESLLKRYLGVKDSGMFMPGHGGMLDRIDSLLFTGFLGYLYVLVTSRVGQA